MEVSQESSDGRCRFHMCRLNLHCTIVSIKLKLNIAFKINDSVLVCNHYLINPFQAVWTTWTHSALQHKSFKHKFRDRQHGYRSRILPLHESSIHTGTGYVQVKFAYSISKWTCNAWTDEYIFCIMVQCWLY